MTFVKKMILLLLTNLAKMDITHNIKCIFLVHLYQFANILYGLQKVGIQ